MSANLIPDLLPALSEIALQKQIVTFLKCDFRERKIVQIFRSNHNVGTLNSLLGEWEYKKDFHVEEEELLRKGNSELSTDLFWGMRPDITLTSTRSGQNRIIIDAKQHAKATHKENDASQFLRYFLHLLVTSDSNPKNIVDIPRGMFLAAPASWFDSKNSSAWHHLVDHYGPIARQFNIVLGEIRAEKTWLSKTNQLYLTMTTGQYFDIRNIASPMGALGTCPVTGCTAILGIADSQWGGLPYCPVHRIRIHAKTRTFVYYNGPDENSKRDAALRNILFERDYFERHILGHAAKAESYRICHETSEDALTWNVYSRMASRRMLASLISTFTGLCSKNEPELYLWGLKVCLQDSSRPKLFPALDCARARFEKGITKFLTEPDIILYVPGQVLVLVEAKFTSGNTIASTSASHDVDGEKPKSREGILKRYSSTELPADAAQSQPTSTCFYSQLYRNLVFAMFMASELNVRWGLVNLVCEKHSHHQPDFQNPTEFIRSVLPEKLHNRFLFYSWERLFADHVAKATELKDLAEYMVNKSAHGIKAFTV
jgi:hypothetical protein